MATHGSVDLPGQLEFHNPTLRALKHLGGSGTIGEIAELVATLMNLSPEQRVIPHKQDHFMYVNRTKWSIHRLFAIGMLSRPRRGVYALTNIDKAGMDIDPRTIEHAYRNRKRLEKELTLEKSSADFDDLIELLPDYKLMIEPALHALRELGGRAKKAQVSDFVAKQLGLSDTQLSLATASGAQYFGLRMDNVRRYCLSEELISNPHAGTWELTEKGWKTESVGLATAGHARRRRSESSAEYSPARSEEAIPLDALIAQYKSWQEELFSLLYTLPPAVFERLFGLIFSAEGVDKVEVVNRSGESEVEGAMTSEGFLSFRVYFKFSRGAKLIGSDEVDEFRRAAQASRADKGLLITTGKFTQEAKRSTKGNVPNVELIDGEQLIDKLKELGLGVATRRFVVEQVVIHPDFFANI